MSIDSLLNVAVDTHLFVDFSVKNVVIHAFFGRWFCGRLVQNSEQSVCLSKVRPDVVFLKEPHTALFYLVTLFTQQVLMISSHFYFLLGSSCY